ncbi:type I secretion system permease/ATPase [Endozoicomonas sp. GU-1]|uniref:type I secretion system permease/ATPase n=1 Tax=Endozoicomonas sp. GU-1 TaxID=3009078 RepID=UPI0022B5A375|nr:type I secretion system permease/ATPase [Endozoicomonas sp. GU-1]WBA81432.1 type I secretion system permease/ATPase [Endozoicomonas sp. GU-1]WBA84379.1 type I secretion system permease/ATPase [Endozoicomonas sp. GU-1]
MDGKGILSAADCLAMLARFHGLPAQPENIRHQMGLGDHPPSDADVLRASRQLGLKGRAISITPEQLIRLPLPAMVRRKDGLFLIIIRISGDQVVTQGLLDQPPEIMSLEKFSEQISDACFLFTKRSLLPESFKKFDLSWFIPALMKHKKLLIEVLAASFFVQIFALITPLFFQVVIDKVVTNRAVTTLNVLAIGLLVLSVFDVLMNGLRSYLLTHTTSRVDVVLGSRLFQHLLRLPVSFFNQRRVGDTVARVRELDTIRDFITSSALTLCVDLVFTIIFFVVMYAYSPTLTWIVLGSIPFYVLLSLVVTPLLRSRLNEKFQRGAENQSFLVESVTGMTTVKSAAVEPQMQRRWEDQLAGYVSASFRANHLGNVSSNLAALISKVVTVLILWVGAGEVIAGALTVGGLIAFNMIAGRVSGPILALARLWQDFQQVKISVEKLGDVLNSPTEPGLSHNRTNLETVQGRVEFENVTFRYQSDRTAVLSQLSLVVNPGEVIGIVGRSGSGKSTLAQLLQRFYIPESGRVLVDGCDLSMASPEWLRQQVGVVSQESFLFNRTIRDNIALSDPSAPIERIIACARLAGAHDFILEQPQGYDTQIGEQGSGLSGGQKQRLAIARALMREPRILIFDEATSALDYHSEHLIQQNMPQICQGRTVFIIAHRLSTVRDADRIIVMDHGVIAEQGSHQQLIANGGHYAQLHAHQQGVRKAV